MSRFTNTDRDGRKIDHRCVFLNLPVTAVSSSGSSGWFTAGSGTHIVSSASSPVNGILQAVVVGIQCTDGDNSIVLLLEKNGSTVCSITPTTDIDANTKGNWISIIKPSTRLSERNITKNDLFELTLTADLGGTDVVYDVAVWAVIRPFPEDA